MSVFFPSCGRYRLFYRRLLKMSASTLPTTVWAAPWLQMLTSYSSRHKGLSINTGVFCKYSLFNGNGCRQHNTNSVNSSKSVKLWNHLAVNSRVVIRRYVHEWWSNLGNIINIHHIAAWLIDTPIKVRFVGMLDIHITFVHKEASLNWHIPSPQCGSRRHQLPTTRAYSYPQATPAAAPFPPVAP